MPKKKARVTAKQRTARRKNMAIARKYRHSGKGSTPASKRKAATAKAAKGGGSKLTPEVIAGMRVRKSSLGGPKGFSKSQKSRLDRDLLNLDRPRRGTHANTAAAKRYDAYAKKGWVKATKLNPGKGNKTVYSLTDKGFRAHNKMFYE